MTGPIDELRRRSEANVDVIQLGKDPDGDAVLEVLHHADEEPFEHFVGG